MHTQTVSFALLSFFFLFILAQASVTLSCSLSHKCDVHNSVASTQKSILLLTAVPDVIYLHSDSITENRQTRLLSKLDGTKFTFIVPKKLTFDVS